MGAGGSIGFPDDSIILLGAVLFGLVKLVVWIQDRREDRKDRRVDQEDRLSK